MASSRAGQVLSVKQVRAGVMTSPKCPGCGQPFISRKRSVAVCDRCQAKEARNGKRP